MYERYENAYYASEIAQFLERNFQGENCVVYEPRSVGNPADHCLLFVDRASCPNFDFGSLDRFQDVLVLSNHPPSRSRCAFIQSEDPRLDFVRVLNHFFVRPLPIQIHPTAVVHPKARIGKDVSIGAHAFIGSEVVLGDETAVHPNAVIQGRVTIGKRCVIKANATLGSEGFSFVFDKEQLQHFPQIGGILIGDDVWIGANSTVERAALDETVVEDGVKIDDLVQIGHGARVGRLTMVTCGVIVCGRAVIGERCWLAPRATINNGVKLGDRVLVGMGAVVLKDVAERLVVAGVPARVLRRREDAE